MKKYIVAKIDSHVDIITNSSSEIFVGGTGENIILVKSVLSKLLEAYNEAMIQRKEIKEPIKFDEVFGSIYIADKAENCWSDYDVDIKKGQLVIESADSNSIPWSFFEMIEELFGMQRHHLG